APGHWTSRTSSRPRTRPGGWPDSSARTRTPTPPPVPRCSGPRRRTGTWQSACSRWPARRRRRSGGAPDSYARALAAAAPVWRTWRRDDELCTVTRYSNGNPAVTAGQLTVSAEGQQWRFPPGSRALVGRGLDCQVILADTRVSRRHLEIAW